MHYTACPKEISFKHSMQYSGCPTARRHKHSMHYTGCPKEISYKHSMHYTGCPKEISYKHSMHYTWCPKEERSIFWEVTVSVILNKKVYMHICHILNGFRDTAILLYSSKTVNKKEILRTVSNTGIYCSSDKVGTVYLV
jgi:hypothetical protein